MPPFVPTRRQILPLATGALFAGSAAQAATLDVRAFGAQGDGRHDDTDAIQRAIEQASVARGIVWLPPCDTSQGKYWRLTRPLFLRSNVTIAGEGPNSLLYNDRRESTTFMDQAVILPGNYHPEFLNTIEFDRARLIGPGTNTLEIANPNKRYAANQTVFVRSQDYDPARPTVSISSFTLICRVLAAHSGKILVDRPIVFGGPLVVAPADGQVAWRRIGDPSRCFVCIDAKLENLAIRSNGFWTGDTAARGCRFTNLFIESRVGIYGNLFQECVWKNIDLTFDRLAIELACNSTDVLVENLKAKMSRDLESPTHQIIAIQESARRCMVRNFFVDADAFTKTAPVVRFGPSSHCALLDGKILCKQARGAMISFDTGVARVEHNQVRNVSFHGNSAATGIAFEPRLQGDVSDNHVDQVRIEGLATAEAARIGGSNNIISNSYLTGDRLVVLSGAANCIVKGSAIPNKVVNSSSDSEAVKFLGNQTH